MTLSPARPTFARLTERLLGQNLLERAPADSSIATHQAPPSPSTPTGFVVGPNVHLRWDNPGNVSEFELQFGFAPGTTAGSLRLGLETSLGITNVPPGVYYVRVRAINEIGTSPPSPEIRVEVQ